jgi:hypothetical protein
MKKTVTRILLLLPGVLSAQEREKGEFSIFSAGPSAGVNYSSTATLDLNYYADFYNPLNNRFNLIATTDLGLELGTRNFDSPVLGFRGGASIAWGLHAENFVSVIMGVQPVLYTSFRSGTFFVRPSAGLLFGNVLEVSVGFNLCPWQEHVPVLPYNDRVLLIILRPWFNAEARRIHL